MTTKTSGKTKVRLMDGPFHGQSMYLGTDSTFKFSAKGYIGFYEKRGWDTSAQWKGTIIGNPTEINPNIILGSE